MKGQGALLPFLVGFGLLAGSAWAQVANGPMEAAQGSMPELPKGLVINPFELRGAEGEDPVQSNMGRVRVLLEAEIETTLVSPLDGRVESLPLSIGQSFSKGAVLVTFVCDERIARLAMGEAELAAAQINHENKVKLQGLSQAGEIEVALAANEVVRARAQFDLFQAQKRQCAVQAPFDGRAARIAVKPFQGVSQGQPVIEIISAGPLKLRLNVPAQWLRWLTAGAAFNVIIDEIGKAYPAHVTAINSRVETVTHTVEVEARLDKSVPDLLPGMSGIADFGEREGR